MDAEAAPEKSDRTFSPKAVAILLQHAADQECQAFASVVLGNDLRFDAQDVLGQALRVDGRLLH